MPFAPTKPLAASSITVLETLILAVLTRLRNVHVKGRTIEHARRLPNERAMQMSLTRTTETNLLTKYLPST